MADKRTDRPTSVRLDKEDIRLLDELRAMLNIPNDSDALRYAIRAFARLAKIESSDVWARKLNQRLGL